MKKLILSATVALTALAASANAAEILIYTGGGTGTSGEGSTYHEGMGQGVAEFLEPIADELGYTVRLVPSNGAVDNAEKVALATDTIVFGIGQGGLSYDAVDAGKTKIVRADLPGECAMAFTAEPRIQDWGDVVSNANRVTWVVPKDSGSEAFIKKMYAEDGNLNGEPSFKYVSGSDQIVSTVKNPANRGTLGFYFAYPNPLRGLVNTAAKEDLSIFGVLSPDVARGDSAYYLNRKAPYKLSWFGLGETQTTRAMCAKALLFVNDIDHIQDPWTSADAQSILEAVAAAPASAFVPNGGALGKLMQQVEKMSDEVGISGMVSDLEAQIKSR